MLRVGEAARFSKPARRAISGYLPYPVDRPGNRTPIAWLQARHLPVGRAAHVFNQRSVCGIERAPPRSGGPSALPRRRAVSAPTDQIVLVAVIPDGIEPSLSCMSR